MGAKRTLGGKRAEVQRAANQTQRKQESSVGQTKVIKHQAEIKLIKMGGFRL